MSSLLGLLRRESQLSAWVPWGKPASPVVQLLSDGSAMAAFAVDGRSWAARGDAVLSSEHNQLNGLMQNAASDALVITTYECRGEASPDIYPAGRFRSAFAESLDHGYRDRLLDHELYHNSTFVVLQIRPARPMGEWLGAKVDKRGWSAGAEAVEQRVERLERLCGLLAGGLAGYGVRRLHAAKQRGRVLYNEITEAVAYALTGHWRPCPVSRGAQGGSMFCETVHFGHETIALRGPGWMQYVAAFGAKRYPAAYWPGLFAHLKAAPYRHTIVHSFRPMSLTEGQDILSRKQNKMVIAGDKAASQVAELSTAADRLARGDFVMGDHSFALYAFADTAKAPREVATLAWNDLNKTGMAAAREGLGCMASWLSGIPGNHHLRVRPGAISSRAFTAFVPFHGYAMGEHEGFWGPPLCMFRTQGGTPYRFHLHANGVGNVFVSGKTGSGKTVILGFLAAQAEKTGAQVFLCDKDRGLEIATRALGGSYARLRNGVPYLAPLKALDGEDADDMTLLRGLLRGCIMAGGAQDITPEEDRRLSIGLRQVMGEAPEDRWLRDIVAFLPVGDPLGARARLTPWEWGNELGWIIDGPEHLLDMGAPVVGVDQTEILDNPEARGPILAVLFHLWTKNPEGQRRIFVLDEVWKSLMEPAFAAMIHNGLKTFRKYNWPILLATQSPRDGLNSSLAHTIREQCPTHIHCANPNATVADYGPDGIGLPEPAVEVVRNLQPGSGMFVLRQEGYVETMQLKLHGMGDELAVLSGTPEAARLLDGMDAETLADPARMLRVFHALRASKREAVPA